VSLTIRALLLIWPFLKRALFGDRTIKEVVLANKHITIVYVCFGLVAIALTHVVVELSVVKSEIKAHPHEFNTSVTECTPAETLLVRRRLLGDILK